MSATRAKNQGPTDAFPFNCPIALDFPVVTASGTTQNNSVIAARLVLPCAVKIYRVTAVVWGSVAGTASLNVVLGTAGEVANSGATLNASLPIPDTDYAGQPIAPATVAYPPAYPTAGQKLFLADRAITMSGADVVTVFTPDDSAASGAFAAGTPGSEWDAIWGPGGTEVTLRLPCSGATASVKVSLLCKTYDPFPTKPILATFNPAVDIP